MDQEKIGKFIAKCRKDKKLTQLELAEKIGVTDKAISKWENGRGMPDISLLEPLSEALNISINELIKGNKICQENIIIETDNNLMVSLKENKTIKAKNIKLKIAIVFIIVLFPLLILSMGEFCHAPIISFSSFNVMRYSKRFYNILKSDNYEIIGNSITEKYMEDQWHSSITNYSTSDFITGLKELKKEGFDFYSFQPQKFYWNGFYRVEYKISFIKDNEIIDFNMFVTEDDSVKNKYLFVLYSDSLELNELELKIIRVFNPTSYQLDYLKIYN